MNKIIKLTIDDIDNLTPATFAKGVCERYIKDYLPYYKTLNKNNRKNYEKAINEYKEMFLNSFQTTAFGNRTYNRKFEEWERKGIDKAYEEYKDEFIKIYKKYIPDVEGYQYADEWIIPFFYIPTESYEDLPSCDVLTDIAFSIALTFCDEAVPGTERYNKLIEFVSKIQLRDEIQSKFEYLRDSTHPEELLLKITQTVYDHNANHVNFDGKHYFYENYLKHDPKDIKHNLYRNLLSIIGDDIIKNIIDPAEKKGMELYELAIKSSAAACNELPNKMKQADKDIKNIEKEFRHISGTKDISKIMSAPLANPLAAINRIQDISMRNKVNDPYYEIMEKLDDHAALINDIEYTREMACNYSLNYYDVIMEPLCYEKKIKEDYEKIADKLDIQMMDISNPYKLIAGIILGFEQGESFPYILNVYTQLFMLCLSMFPWRFNAPSEILDLVHSSWDISKLEANNAIYDVQYKIEASDDVDVELSYAKMIYMTTGLIPPRNFIAPTNMKAFYDKADVQEAGATAMFSSILQVIRRRIESTKIAYELCIKQKEKEYNKKPELSGGQVKEMRAEKEQLEKELYSIKNQLQETNSQYDKLLRKYEADMKELAQLRENMFLSQTKEEQEEIIEDNLPYELTQNVVIYGGHEKWISRLKESLQGNIKIYPPNITTSKSQIINADIVYIQTTYIDHKTYYAVMDMLKANDIKFVCLNTSSANNAVKIIIQNDKDAKNEK